MTTENKTVDLLMNAIKDNQKLTNHKPIFMTTEKWREELRKSLYERHFSTTQAEESYLEVEAMIDALLSKERIKEHAVGYKFGYEDGRKETLDKVKKEVEELNKLSLCGKCEISTKNELSHTQLCNYKKKISTLLENLKV